MNFKKLLSEENAVSPVIGVILMVAITVILAAVIGAFVIGIGEDQEVQPTASFNFDFESDGIATVSHTTGDSIESPDTLEVLVDGETGEELASTDEADPWTDQATGSISAGSEFLIGGDGSAFDADDEPGMKNPDGDTWDGQTVSVIWTSETGDSSSTLSSQDAPN